MFIKKIYFHALQNEEHAGFNTYVADYISEAGAEALNVVAQAAEHKQKLAIEKSVLDLVRKNVYTQRVQVAEDARDKPIRGFVDRINALITIEGNAKYAAFVTSMNNRIDQYHTAIAQRKARTPKAPVA